MGKRTSFRNCIPRKPPVFMFFVVLCGVLGTLVGVGISVGQRSLPGTQTLPSENREHLKDNTVNGLILWNPAKLTGVTAKLVNDYLDGKKPADGMEMDVVVKQRAVLHHEKTKALIQRAGRISRPLILETFASAFSTWAE